MGFLAATMAQCHKFNDLVETAEGLVAFINSSQPEKLRQVKDEHQALFDNHMKTKKIVAQILKGKWSDILYCDSAVYVLSVKDCVDSFTFK